MTRPTPAIPTCIYLEWHPLEKFGCSPCHGGNGRAINSVQRGHGRYEHWLWPLYYPENYDAGCQQCHSADMVTEHAPVLNEGKQLYRQKGCIGCHRFKASIIRTNNSSTRASKYLAARQNQIRQRARNPAPAETRRHRRRQRRRRSFYAQATNLTVDISRMDATTESLESTQP